MVMKTVHFRRTDGPVQGTARQDPMRDSPKGNSALESY